MKWIKIFWIVISCCQLELTAQTLEQTYQFAQSQFSLGNQRAAEKAFKRVLFFDKQNLFRTECLIRLSQISDLNADPQATLNYLDQAYFQTDDVHRQYEIQFDRIKILVQTADYQKALAEIYQMDADLSADRLALYEGFCHYMLKDFLSSEAAFGTLCHTLEKKQALNLLIEEAHKIEKINPRTYQILSYIVPGMGQIILGDARNSINSILLNGALVILFIDTARKLSFFDATISVLPWLFRYYTGGTKVARDLAIQKKKERHEDNLRQIIIHITHP